MTRDDDPDQAEGPEAAGSQDEQAWPMLEWRRFRDLDLGWWDWGGEPDTVEAVVFLHGLLNSGRVWDPILRRLPADLRGRYRMVAPDLLGHGISAKPNTGYGAEDVAAEVVSLLDTIGIQKAVLVGHSRGGWIIAALARYFAERIAGVVILEWSPVVGQPDHAIREHYRRAYARQAGFPDGAAARAAAQESPYPPGWDDDREAGLWSWLEQRQDGTVTSRLPPDLLEAICDEYIASPDVRSDLAAVDAPALVITASPLSDVDRDRRMVVARHLRHASVVQVTGPHWLMYAQPDRVAQLLGDFLGDLALRGTG